MITVPLTLILANHGNNRNNNSNRCFGPCDGHHPYPVTREISTRSPSGHLDRQGSHLCSTKEIPGSPQQISGTDILDDPSGYFLGTARIQPLYSEEPLSAIKAGFIVVFLTGL